MKANRYETFQLQEAQLLLMLCRFCRKEAGRMTAKSCPAGCAMNGAALKAHLIAICHFLPPGNRHSQTLPTQAAFIKDFAKRKITNRRMELCSETLRSQPPT